MQKPVAKIDDEIGPLAKKEGQGFNSEWGYVLRTGSDKSHLTRQIEKYADIYTSRVSNFRSYTPFMFFRSFRGASPHDVE